jgi:hypothetical protein
MMDNDWSERFSVKRALRIAAGFVVASVASLAGAWATVADTVVESGAVAEKLSRPLRAVSPRHGSVAWGSMVRTKESSSALTLSPFLSKTSFKSTPLCRAE